MFRTSESRITPLWLFFDEGVLVDQSSVVVCVSSIAVLTRLLFVFNRLWFVCGSLRPSVCPAHLQSFVILLWLVCSFSNDPHMNFPFMNFMISCDYPLVSTDISRGLLLWLSSHLGSCKSADNIMVGKKKRFKWMFHFLILLPHSINGHYKCHAWSTSADPAYPIFNPATLTPTIYKETVT